MFMRILFRFLAYGSRGSEDLPANLFTSEIEMKSNFSDGHDRIEM